MGDIPSGSELLCYLFPAFRVSGAVQIFILEFREDGLAYLGDELIDSGSVNQPAMKGGVGLGIFKFKF